MSDELKPVRCGCGGEAIIGLKEWEDRKGNYHENSFVYCNDCSISTGGYLTEAEAVTAWNTAMGTNARTLMKVFAHDATCAVCDKNKERTAKVKKVTRVSSVIRTGRCGDYGYDVIDSYKHCPNCGAKLDWSGNETDRTSDKGC